MDFEMLIPAQMALLQSVWDSHEDQDAFVCHWQTDNIPNDLGYYMFDQDGFEPIYDPNEEGHDLPDVHVEVEEQK